MDYARLIVAQVDRAGYRCAECDGWHRRGEPVYYDHLLHAADGVTFWCETLAVGWSEEFQIWVRLPSALGLAALAHAEAQP